MNAARHADAADDRQAGSSKHPKAPHIRTPAPAQRPPSMGMSPLSRYNHNIKVLRRRDPSIISIFDQFSHVCVYHHNGMKWEKQGFEGSMFLYERDSYPPYGFYILNRMGMEDYIHRLYPEDDIGAHGSYLMIRSYPDFTAERLGAISPDTLLDKFSDVYFVPNLDKLGYNDKGRSQTVGLWMFATDAREPMIDVMLRLHSFIKKNIPYPEEFRYGPGKPPPPNPNPRKSSSSRKLNRADTSPTKSAQSHESTSENESATSSEDIFSPPPDGLSELDKLFMKLQPPSTPSSVPATPNIISSTAIPLVSQSTSKMTVDCLFAALSGPDSAQSSTSVQPSTTTANTKATSLLNSIFASAIPTPSTNTVPTNIHSPTPTTTSSGPQVLSQDVLSNLLGFPPSRSASVVSASSTYSSNAPSMLSARSHPSSREGDDEEESDVGWIDDVDNSFTYASDRGPNGRSRQIGSRAGTYSSGGGYPQSSIVLEEAELERTVSRSGARPSLAQAAEGLFRGNAQTVPGLYSHDQGDTNGDVTPRPPVPTNTHSSLLRMSSTSRLQGTARIQRGNNAGGRASVPPMAPSVEHSLSTSTVRAAPQTNGSTTEPKHRPLVPFSADSELWPYPLRPSSSDLSTSGGDNGDDGEILELDFEETSALSDMNAFRRAMRRGKERSLGVNASASSAGSGAEGFDMNGRGKGRKKTKKEMEAEKREQIENSWDAPVPVANPAPPVPFGLGVARSPTPSRRDKVVNGTSGHGHQTKKQPVANGNPVGATVESGIVKDSLIGTLLGHSQKPARLEKNAFVREVLTLIHTDKSFVDTLWKEYLNQLDT